jgi:hypothetical protein
MAPYIVQETVEETAKPEKKWKWRTYAPWSLDCYNEVLEVAKGFVWLTMSFR